MILHKKVWRVSIKILFSIACFLALLMYLGYLSIRKKTPERMEELGRTRLKLKGAIEDTALFIMIKVMFVLLLFSVLFAPFAHSDQNAGYKIRL